MAKGSTNFPVSITIAGEEFSLDYLLKRGQKKFLKDKDCLQRVKSFLITDCVAPGRISKKVRGLKKKIPDFVRKSRILIKIEDEKIFFLSWEKNKSVWEIKNQALKLSWFKKPGLCVFYRT